MVIPSSPPPARVVAPLVLLFVTVALSAQNAPVPKTVTGESADVPMLLRGVEPAVSVMVNGKGPYLFAIDTGGAGDGRPDASLVAALGLEVVGEARGASAPGAPTQSMPIVRVDSLAIGGITLEHVDVPSRDYNTSPSLGHIDGILGFNAFSDFLLTLDFPHRRVRIARGELPPSDGRSILDFDLTRRVPMVPIVIGDKTTSAVLDTGNVTDEGIVLPDAAVAGMAVEPSAGRSPSLSTVSGAMAARVGTLKSILTLGAYSTANPRVLVVPAGGANLGSHFLQQFVVTFDQKNGRVRFEPAAP